MRCVTFDIIVAVFESQVWCWLELDHVFLWAAFLPEWSACGLCTNSHRRARDCTLSLVRPSVITCWLTKLLWYFVSSVAYTFQNLQLATCCNQLHCPWHNARVFLSSTSAQLLFCSLDVTIAQDMCENHTNKLIGSTLLPYQCFLQILPNYCCYNICDIFLTFCQNCWLCVLIWQRKKTFPELCTVPVAAFGMFHGRTSRRCYRGHFRLTQTVNLITFTSTQGKGLPIICPAGV